MSHTQQMVPVIDIMVEALRRVDERLAASTPENAELVSPGMTESRLVYARMLINQYERILIERDGPVPG